LPDAMEGPTPVSALIHAATMVAAGVFLVGRFLPVFPDEVLQITVVIGAITALGAAILGTVMNDVKKVLAYSTISQLGYMVMALGMFLSTAAFFHLFTHAFFKALLFLGAGSLSHAVGTFDMKKMGGLKQYMPWTYMFFIIGTFSLVGFFPFSGFWSKDEILAQIVDSNRNLNNLIYIVGSAGVFFTSFYMFRALLMIFEGNYDVIVTDGFAGNIALKSIEGVANIISHFIKNEFKKNLYNKFSALISFPVMKGVRKKVDPRRYNGASLLGLQGVVVKSHGGADSYAFARAIRTAYYEVKNGVLGKIESLIESKLSK